MAPAEAPAPRPVRCAIYTRKSTEEGLSQEFNSLDAQRECAPRRFSLDGYFEVPGEAVLVQVPLIQ